MKTKRFNFRTLLSVTTGRLLTKDSKDGGNGIEDMYELLGWMTGDEPFTHSLGRFCKECKPWLLRWFPELATVDDDIRRVCEKSKGYDKVGRYETIERLMVAVQVTLGKTWYNVPKIPADDHETKDPVAELEERLGTSDGIVVI